jgi:short-subunit dehydrogenase
MVKAGKGQIVIFGSIAGSVLASHLAAYCATKAATNAYVEILIEETRHTGVHVMLVCPPMVNTPLLKQAKTGSNPKNIQMAKEKNRLASPEFIVDQVEKGLQKRTEILIPGGEAKTLVLLRRWMPRLLWKIIHLSMK